MHSLSISSYPGLHSHPDNSISLLLLQIAVISSTEIKLFAILQLISDNSDILIELG